MTPRCLLNPWRFRNKIDILNVSSQLHAQGIPSLQEVTYAQIEPNGQITVVCDGAKMPSVIVMKDGKARIAEFSSIEKDEAWLAFKLNDAGIDPHAVFLAEFWNGKLSFILNNGEVKFSI